MNIFDLAQKILGREKSTADKSETENQSGSTIMYMTAVTSSSNGEVILTDEEETPAEWTEGDYTEVLEDGEYTEEDVPEDDNDIDDGVIDMTDGDGADIEDSASGTTYTVAAYQADAQAAYAAETAAAESGEDEPPGEDATITTDTDDGDAKDLPDTGGDTEDPEAGEDATVDDLPDTDYTLVDDDVDDVSDVVESAEASDGYMAAETIGTVNEGDRVAVMIQDGKPIVLGVVGSGDEQRAETEINSEAIDAVAETADASAQKIATWCAENDQTMIDGGKIYTGSIGAEKISVSDLYALGATIGGFTIGKEAIYNGASERAAVGSDAVYMGLNGISTSATLETTDLETYETDLYSTVIDIALGTLSSQLHYKPSGSTAYALSSESSMTEGTFRVDANNKAMILESQGLTYWDNTEEDPEAVNFEIANGTHGTAISLGGDVNVRTFEDGKITIDGIAPFTVATTVLSSQKPAANTGFTLTKKPTAIDGYTAIGTTGYAVVGAVESGSNVANIAVRAAGLNDSGNLFCNGKNTGSAAANVDVKWWVLYVKNQLWQG